MRHAMQVLIDTVAANICNSLRPPPHTTEHLIFGTCIAPIHVLASTQQPLSAVPAQPERQPTPSSWKSSQSVALAAANSSYSSWSGPVLTPVPSWASGGTGTLAALACCTRERYTSAVCFSRFCSSVTLVLSSPRSCSNKALSGSGNLTCFAHAISGSTTQGLPGSCDMLRK